MNNTDRRQFVDAKTYIIACFQLFVREGAVIVYPGGADFGSYQSARPRYQSQSL